VTRWPRGRAAALAAALAGVACQRVEVNVGRLCSEPATDPGWNCGAGCLTDPAAGARASTLFDGPPDQNPDNKPVIVYPLDGAMVPVNLPAPITFQWKRGPNAVQTLFHIHLEGGAHAYDLYAPCVPPPSIPVTPPLGACTYTPPEAAWRAIAAETIGGELTATLAATDDKHRPVATSEPVKLRFSPEPVTGALYYFSAMLQGIYRLPFGARQPQTFIAPNGSANHFACGGCHAISRKGDVVAFAAGYEGYLTSAPAGDPDHPTIVPTQPLASDGHVSTLSPDGKYVLSSYGAGDQRGLVKVRETRTGIQVATLDPAMLGQAGSKVFFPDWSPDGKEIVATLASDDTDAWVVKNGAIVAFPYNGGAFGPARTIVAASQELFHYYPTWSPDGRWILFVSAPPGATSRSNSDSRLRLVSSGGGAVHDLRRATQATGKTSTWPRFAPVAPGNERLLFFTFNSKIDYGYLLRNTTEPTPYPQIWMAAIDLDRLVESDPSSDPSTAPVWLPFQNPRENNLQATWAESIPCTPGGPGFACGPGTTCTGGACLPCGQ
jgi:Tol biopolymer transport system component